MSPRTPQTPPFVQRTRPRRSPRVRLRRYAAAALAATLAAGVAAGADVSAQAATPHATLAPSIATAQAGRTLPDRIGARPGVHQMVTVTSQGWSTTHAVLRAWQRLQDGRWRLVRGPVRARIGYGGWVQAEKRVQSTGTTPAGRFRLPYAFGRLADPGAHLQYRRFDSTDWWPYEPRDPATYNVWQWHKAATTHWRSDKAEHLWDYPDQYAYAAVIGFNLPGGIHYSHRKRQWVADNRADTTRGGGIFLHVNGSGATAGCVSVKRTQMRWILRWLRPAAHAQIVMGPTGYVVGL